MINSTRPLRHAHTHAGRGTHNRDGGFYWHGEIDSGAGFLLRSYHWPGFPSGERYDESGVMDLLRTKAFEIRGLQTPPIEAPRAPTLLPISSPGAISWQGSVGARSYALERARKRAGPWTVLDSEVFDDVAYTPIYNDAAVAIGATYFYRVTARNESGVSSPSNVVGPVKAGSRAIVDDAADFSRAYEHTADLGLADTQNRPVSERLSRFTRTAAVGGESIVYRIDGIPDAFKVFSYCQSLGADFSIAISRNGVDYRPFAPNVSRFGDGPGVYGYWYRVLFDGSGVPPDTRFLKIGFPNLITAQSPQVSRVEIDYVPHSVKSIRTVVRFL